MGCWRTLHRSAAGNEDIRKCQTPLFYSLWDRKLHKEVTEASFIAATMANDYSLCVLEIVFLLLWLEKCYEQGILIREGDRTAHEHNGESGISRGFFKKITSREGFGAILAEGVCARSAADRQAVRRDRGLAARFSLWPQDIHPVRASVCS